MESTKNIKINDNSDDMTVKIQTLDNVHPLVVKRSFTVQELKDKIYESFNIPVQKQRLIYQGKLLQNAEKLKNYKISDDNVIHLVAKTDDVNPINQNNENTESVRNDDVYSSLIEIPVIRTGRRTRRRRIPHFDISECFESMHQNLSTMQNIINCKTKFDDNVFQSKNISSYDFTKSKYEVGQWVDVKDTIDQWLEAQVIQVRNNQVFVHYNGWGTRWDEWIDCSSPRIAAFKTYTLQSPASIFLSPYPQVHCDANVEPQHRSIDSFYYMEKTCSHMNDLIKTVDYMSKLRKKNLNRDNHDEESKSNKSGDNRSGFTANDYELLFLTSQVIPVLDRVGRMMSDISQHLSHLILNPNLYPQLLLGYNQNIEVSDNLSCTSGYSMYTNEGSTVSMTNNLNDLKRNINPRNIQNSNQMINNYIQTNSGNTSGNNNSLGYSVSSSSNELPFIHRLMSSGNTINQVNELYPKINLQMPSMLSPGDVAMMTGYNGFPESNIDIYVHTLVTSPSTVNNTNNININRTTTTNSNTANVLNNETNTINTDLINNLINNRNNINRENNTVDNSTNTNIQVSNNSNQNNQLTETNPSTNQNETLNNLIENLMNIISQPSARRGSVTSDTSNNSSRNTRSNTNLQNNLTNINRNMRENSTQTELPINLLTLQKDKDYNENTMEIFSNKSDKNFSLRNKNTVSYKSVSEIDEFEECVEAESSEFVIQTKKNNKNMKLNESSHSDVVSNFSKDNFEEKDEDKN